MEVSPTIFIQWSLGQGWGGGECKPRVSTSGLSGFKLHVNHTFISQQSVVFHSFISHYFAAIYHALKRYSEIELVIVR